MTNPPITRADCLNLFEKAITRDFNLYQHSNEPNCRLYFSTDPNEHMSLYHFFPAHGPGAEPGTENQVSIFHLSDDPMKDWNFIITLEGPGFETKAKNLSCPSFHSAYTIWREQLMWLARFGEEEWLIPDWAKEKK